MIEIKSRINGEVIKRLKVKNLRKANLRGADLTGANLSGATLTGAALTRADTINIVPSVGSGKPTTFPKTLEKSGIPPTSPT